MTNNKQQPQQENPNNQFSNSEPMTFAQKVDYIKNINMTNNKQQTAVEFYLDKVFDIIGDAILDKLSIEQINKIHHLSLQAKEMEKEQKRIELPSHHEIWEEAIKEELNQRRYDFMRGADFVRDKIQGQSVKIKEL